MSKEWPLWEVFIRGSTAEPPPRRQPARAGRRDGDQERPRRLHPPQRGRVDLGREVGSDITASEPVATRGRCSSRRTPRSIATRPSTTSPKKWGTCDAVAPGHEHARRRRARPRRRVAQPPHRDPDARRRPGGLLRDPAPHRRHALILGHRVSRVVRPRAGARRGHRARQRRARPDRPDADVARPRRRGRGQGPHARTISPTCATPGTSATCCSSSARTAISAHTLMRQFLFDALHLELLKALAASAERARRRDRREGRQGGRLSPRALLGPGHPPRRRHGREPRAGCRRRSTRSGPITGEMFVADEKDAEVAAAGIAPDPASIGAPGSRRSATC